MLHWGKITESDEPLHPLPDLIEEATAYPGCCLALSRPLLEFLHRCLPIPPGLILSIGSGFGLLEAHLDHLYQLRVIGVEVEPSSNRYLPTSHHRTVPGSRSLETMAAEATVWLFVYPRRVDLIREYLAEYGNNAVQRIIWAGPQADWDDYKDCFDGQWKVVTHDADEAGGRAWELLAIASKI